MPGPSHAQTGSRGTLHRSEPGPVSATARRADKSWQDQIMKFRSYVEPSEPMSGVVTGDDGTAADACRVHTHGATAPLHHPSWRAAQAGLPDSSPGDVMRPPASTLP